MQKFGLNITGGIRPPTQLDYDFAAFRLRKSEEDGGLGPKEHFKRIAEVLYGPGKSDFEFVWTDQVDEMVRGFCDYDVVSVCGHASSSKSATSALWAIINWLADPENTKIIVVSTDLKGARKRIWGTIEEMFYALPKGTGSAIRN